MTMTMSRAGTVIRTAMTDTKAAGLLQIWFSPLFPTGAFAYSHGLEWAQEAGLAAGREPLILWLTDLIQSGSIRADIALASVAHRAAETADDALLRETAELALALAPSSERHLETVQQGNAFAAAIRSAWNTGAMRRLSEVWPGDIALPVAAGVAAAGHGIARARFLQAFAIGGLANLVSAAIRLGIIGQTDGQKTLARLISDAAAMARSLAEASLADAWSAAFRSDLASLCHETQYTRLFRS